MNTPERKSIDRGTWWGVGWVCVIVAAFGVWMSLGGVRKFMEARTYQGGPLIVSVGDSEETMEPAEFRSYLRSQGVERIFFGGVAIVFAGGVVRKGFRSARLSS